MADTALRIGGSKGSRKNKGPFIGPGPMPSPSRRGERWDAWEEFDKPPGSAIPASIAYQNQFNSHEWLTTAPMPVGHRNGYLHLWASSGSPGAWVWLGLENWLGTTYATWSDGPGYNRGIEVLYRAAVRNSTVGVNHHRSPRMNVMHLYGAFGMRHLAATTEALMVQKDNSGGNESLSSEQGGPFDWSGQKWVWNRIRIYRYRMWLKSWADTVSEPGPWLFENYDTTALANEPLTDYICRQANWHEDPHVYLANYGVKFLNLPRELMIQYDFPMSGQTFNCPMSCVIDVRFTYETDKALDIFFRRLDGDHTLYVRIDEDGAVKLIQDNAGETELASASAVFTNGQWAVVRIEANGKSIKIYANDALVINHTTTFQISQAGGRVEHDYATNDIMLKVYS